VAQRCAGARPLALPGIIPFAVMRDRRRELVMLLRPKNERPPEMEAGVNSFGEGDLLVMLLPRPQSK
jgi:hypothetical protein